jgi:hypothetical protein
VYPVGGSSMRPASQQQAKIVPYPAPSAGINALSNLSEMAPQDAIYAFNMVSAQYGLRTRRGYSEWCTNVGTNGVKTVIPFQGLLGDKFFACAQNGIYDVTTSSTVPTLKIAFPIQDANSGRGIWFISTNAGAGKFICYCDESNGYFVYTEATNTWVQIAAGAGPTDIAGVNPNNLCFVMSWKNRIWFVEKNTGSAWYLAAGSIYGTATKFEFGNKFKYGGSLVALFNWTVDGGIGVDDYLVGISAGGDVIVYQGTDPSVATSIDQRGTYYIGPPPAGRRIAGTFGGELFLLSTYGLIPITKLLSGQTIAEIDIFTTARITPLINGTMGLSRAQQGWEVKFVPSQNLLMIMTPKQTSQSYIQLVQSTDTKGWSVYRDFPCDTGDTWLGDFYFGTSDNKIMKHTGGKDAVTLAAPTGGIAIVGSILSMFSDLGAPGESKITQFIRPTFIADRSPSYVVRAVYDYNLTEITATPVSAGTATGSLWDVGLWDAAVWGGDFLTTNVLNGAEGMGRAVGIALKTSTISDTTLIKFDVAVTKGNAL